MSTKEVIKMLVILTMFLAGVVIGGAKALSSIENSARYRRRRYRYRTPRQGALGFLVTSVIIAIFIGSQMWPATLLDETQGKQKANHLEASPPLAQTFTAIEPTNVSSIGATFVDTKESLPSAYQRPVKSAAVTRPLYYMQVDCFKDFDNAQRRRISLEQTTSYPVEIQHFLEANLYKVLIGPFQDSTTAATVKKKMRWDQALIVKRQAISASDAIMKL